MKKLTCALLLSIMMLLIVGCSKENTQSENLKSSEDVTLKKADKFKPIHASFEVSVDLLSVCIRMDGDVIPNDNPYPFVYPPYPTIPFMKYQDVYGDGNASHLGNTEVKLEQWWRPTLDPAPPAPGAPFHEWSGIGCGEIYFTAANGDVLLADYNGAIAVHLSPDYVETTLTGNFKDGGTGRFAHAEGEFHWEVQFYPFDNFGTVTVIGDIKYSK